MVAQGLRGRIAALEGIVLRPPVSMLTDAELRQRIDGYLVRLVAGSDQELAAAAQAMQEAPDCPDASRRLTAALRASLARETLACV